MAIVKKYLVEVADISNPLEGLYTVSFSSEKGFRYLPGQFLHLALDEFDGTGQWPDSRCFSMQSSPAEKNLRISYAVKGDFTKRMEKELTVGKSVWLKLAYGDIFQRGVQKENSVFIAGGTGITPFLSLFKDESFKEYQNPRIYLGFRSEKHNIYSEDLRKCTNNSVVINFMYQNEGGLIDIDKIFLENGAATYFISGPPQMLKNFRNWLIHHGVPEFNVITDDWE